MSENTNTEMLEFYGRALLERVKEELPGSYVEQTGGGTATLMFFKGAGEPGKARYGEVRIAAGPGSFDWKEPDKSVFNSGEFYFGREDYDFEGNEFPDDAAPERMDPEHPDLGELAQRIIEKYREYNPEVVPEDPEEDGRVFSTKALPGNPFAMVVDHGRGAVRDTAALMALAFELRTRNMMEARRMGAYGVTEQDVADRLNPGFKAPHRK